MDKLVKVLHVVPALDNGGIERLLFNYYKNLSDNGLKFDFLIHTGNIGVVGNLLKSLGCNIHSLPSKRKNLFKYISAFVNFLKINNYEIIHIHQNYSSWLPGLICKIMGFKIIVIHSHNFIKKETLIKKIINFIIRLINLSITNNYLACSLSAGKWLFGKKSSFQVLTNAVELDKFVFNQTKREKFKNLYDLNNKLVIGHVGRFTEQKNHTFVLKTFKEINTLIPNSKLLLVGEGNLINLIKKEVKILKIEKSVSFLGSHSHINDLYNIFDIFLFPSLFEGLGIALIEAQISDLFCFGSDNIPKESFLTKKSYQLSLKLTPIDWANFIIKKYKHDLKRDNNFVFFQKNNYDVKQEALNLQNYYLNLIKIYEKK